MCAERAIKKKHSTIHSTKTFGICWKKSPYQRFIVLATDEQMSLDIGLIYIFIWLEFL